MGEHKINVRQCGDDGEAGIERRLSAEGGGWLAGEIPAAEWQRTLGKETPLMIAEPSSLSTIRMALVTVGLPGGSSYRSKIMPLLPYQKDLLCHRQAENAHHSDPLLFRHHLCEQLMASLEQRYANIAGDVVHCSAL